LSNRRLRANDRFFGKINDFIASAIGAERVLWRIEHEGQRKRGISGCRGFKWPREEKLNFSQCL